MYFDLSNLNTFDFYLTLSLIAAFIILLVMFIRAKPGYSEKDAQTHSINFAGGIREGNGGITVFLWVVISLIIVWTIIYFILHFREFGLIFSL
jgi:hypothetical protein